MSHPRLRGVLALLTSFLVLGLLAASCAGNGGSDLGAASQETTSPPPTETEAAFPVDIAADNGDVTIREAPERIVSLSATATEVLFAIGAGDQVVAVDSTSDYPPDAPTTDLSAFEPNVEAIANHDPDLVVLSDDIGGVVEGLEGIGIAVIQHTAATTFDDTYRQIEQLGTATGHTGDAAEVVAQMQEEIDDIVASAPPSVEGLDVYHELDPTYYSVTSATFIGSVYEMLGMNNIADAAEGAQDYPQLSAEYIVQADPDVIFLADAECCDVTADTVAGRPGWDSIAAVESGAIVELDEDIASRWGPRVVDFMRTVVDAVEEVETSAATPAPTG